MIEGSSRAAIESIADVVRLYETTPEGRAPETTLLGIARVVELMRTELPTGPDILRGQSREIESILTGFRAVFDAKVGQLIGRLYATANADIASEILVHRGRIALLDANDDLPTVFDLLVATGWQAPSSREEWIASPRERALARQTEDFCIGRLEHEQSILRRLYDRFVTRETA